MTLNELVRNMNVLRWAENKEQLDIVDVEDAMKSEKISVADKEDLTRNEVVTLLQWESEVTRNAILRNL